MKRFYKTVDVREADGGWQVALDGRPMKTVGAAQQVVSSEALARALAQEWDEQGEDIDPARFVFRDMADYAIDVIAADPDAIADKLVAFGDTDTLLYRADPDEPLYARQQTEWEPLVGAFERREDIELVRVSGIMHRPQHEASMAKLRARLAGLDAFTLAGMDALTSLSASLVVALSTLDAESEEQALILWRAASLEEDWQAEQWGRDEEAEERRARRQADYLKASEFVRAARA